MSSFVWMKVLESTPQRYDRGIRMLSGGRIDEVYQRIAALAVPEPTGSGGEGFGGESRESREGSEGGGGGRCVLDIGCGTGGVSLACAARGAAVTAIDKDAGMLEVARAKAVPPPGSVAWTEVGVAEVEDRMARGSVDAVVSCLAFSELSEDEQRYALRLAFGLLVPGGVLVIGDEVDPRSLAGRLLHKLRRLPLEAATWLLTGTTTSAVADLATKAREAGFVEVEANRLWEDSFVVVCGRRPAEPHAEASPSGGEPRP